MNRSKLALLSQSHGMYVYKLHRCDGSSTNCIKPTTPGSVSIVLLRGPSINVLPISCIVDGAPNSGKFVWTPPLTLEPDVTHYGLQIIVDGTGQYQYSTQFGISNPSFGVTTSHSTTTTKHTNTATQEHTTTATGNPPLTTSSAVTSQSSYSQIQISTGNLTVSTATRPVIISTLSVNATHVTGSTAPHPTIASTGAPHHNSTLLTGTKTMTVPKTLQSQSGRKTTKTNVVVASATTRASAPTSSSAVSSSPVPQPSSGANHFAAAGGLLAGLGAVAAFIL